MARFEIYTVAQALEKYPENDELLDYAEWNDPEWDSCLIDTAKGEVVWIDGIPPEDATLNRDLSIFVKKLNEVANGN
jgi:hypothetical protein